MIGAHAQNEQLAQVRPAGITAVELLGVRDNRIEITLITISNHGAGNVVIQIYHDDDGSTWTDDTEIFHRSLNANTSEIVFQAQHPGSGIGVKKDGTLGVAVNSANDSTITVYGVSENIAFTRSR